MDNRHKKRCPTSLVIFVVVQCSVMSNSLKLHGLQHARLPCPSPSPKFELAQTHIHWVSDLILCHPVLLLLSIFPSIRTFSNELALLISWPKFWSFSFSISPSNEYSELISFRKSKLLEKCKSKLQWGARFGSTYTKIGMIQRLAQPLRRNDMQIHEAFHIFSSELHKLPEYRKATPNSAI